MMIFFSHVEFSKDLIMIMHRGRRL